MAENVHLEIARVEVFKPLVNVVEADMRILLGCGDVEFMSAHVLQPFGVDAAPVVVDLDDEPLIRLGVDGHGNAAMQRVILGAHQSVYQRVLDVYKRQ